MTPPITALGSRYGIQGALGRSVKRATAGGFNSSDCEQTDIGSAAVLDVGTYQFTLTAAKVQEWISGTLTNNGVLLRDPENISNTFKQFNSSNHATESYRPVLSVTYTAGSTGTLRRTNMNAQMSNLTGGMHG